MDWIKTLSELCSIDAPSGFEERAHGYLTRALEPYTDDIKTDALGNLIAVRSGGSPDAPRLLLDAHIDEIGFVVTGYADDGFLRFDELGGQDARLLPAAEVKILTDPPIFGVIDTIPPHLQGGGDAGAASKIGDLYIDAGLTPATAESTVPIGTPLVILSEPTALGEHQFSAKALDNRASAAIILGALELLGDTKLGIDLYILFSSQEEVGKRGARTAAYASDARLALIYDCDFARQPDIMPDRGRITGGGVVIARGPNMDKALTQLAVDTATGRGIAHQISVEPGGDSGTNAHPVQITRTGVRTALLGVPVKYMHTPVETLDIRDLESAARLTAEVIKVLGGQGQNNANGSNKENDNA
ncbi:MAG: M20/M25/M40 family metallo-hydrolase [Oscillospiraceae bacterium]|jgi:endoglucanase|nr:M20/M25/M40 family metallo-hydrolase [Oscillospiraceae bacterium]